MNHLKTTKNYFIVGLIIVAVGISAVAARRAMSGSSDFDVYYYAAKSAAYGNPLYTLDRHSTNQSGGPFVYPPFFAFLMTPFTLVPIGAAAALWALINLALFIGCIRLALSMFSKPFSFSDRFTSKKTVWLVSFIAVVLLWFFDNVAMAQVNILVLFLILLSLRLYLKNQKVAAGFFLGISAVIKLIPLLFLPYFIIKREWKYTFGFLLALLPAFLVPMAAIGLPKSVDYHKSWIEETLKDHTQPKTLGFYASQLSPSHQNLQAVLFRLLIDWEFRERTGGPNGKRFIFRTPLRLTEVQAANVSRGIVVGLAIVLFFLLWRTQKYHSFLVAVSVLFCAMVVLAPKVRSHFFIFLLLPFSILAREILLKNQTKNENRMEKMVLVSSVAFYFLQGIKYVKFLGAGCWAALILFLYFLIRLFKREKESI